MACHLPWVGVADGDFPRGFPGGFCPLFLFLLTTCLWWERGPFPSLVLVRVIREEPAPLSGRDVYLRFTLFQVHVPWISVSGATLEYPNPESRGRLTTRGPRAEHDKAGGRITHCAHDAESREAEGRRQDHTLRT